MPKEKKGRAKEKFLDGREKYLHTLTARGGRVEDFLSLMGIKNEELPMNLKLCECSVYPVLQSASEKGVVIDFYHGAATQTRSQAFRAGYGQFLTPLIQTGFSPNEWEFTKEEEIINDRRAKESSLAKIDF